MTGRRLWAARLVANVLHAAGWVVGATVFAVLFCVFAVREGYRKGRHG